VVNEIDTEPEGTDIPTEESSGQQSCREKYKRQPDKLPCPCKGSDEVEGIQVQEEPVGHPFTPWILRKKKQCEKKRKKTGLNGPLPPSSAGDKPFRILDGSLLFTS